MFLWFLLFHFSSSTNALALRYCLCRVVYRTMKFWICFEFPKRWFLTEKRLLCLPTTLFLVYLYVCLCWQHSRVVTLLLLLITCKFHRMSHAQHRNLKAFKWFASQPWLAMWRDVTSFKLLSRAHHQSKPRCYAISPRRRRKSRALSLHSLSFLTLSFRCTALFPDAHASGLQKMLLCIKNHLFLSHAQ